MMLPIAACHGSHTSRAEGFRQRVVVDDALNSAPHGLGGPGVCCLFDLGREGENFQFVMIVDILSLL